MKIHPTVAAAFEARNQRGTEQQTEPEREQVAEVDAALHRQDGRRQHHRGGGERHGAVVRDRLRERVGAQHREQRAEGERRGRRPEDHLACQQHDGPAERVLREEVAVAVAAQPGLEERGHASVGGQDLAGPQRPHLPEVHRLVAVPGVRGIDPVVHDDGHQDRQRAEHHERPVPRPQLGRGSPHGHGVDPGRVSSRVHRWPSSVARGSSTTVAAAPRGRPTLPEQLRAARDRDGA
jgi:hypothetical protein